MQRDWAEIKMNNVGDKIIELFSNSFELILTKETCDKFITEYQINTLSLSLLEIDVIDKINARDQIAIYFFETDNAESIDYLSINVNSWNDFVYELQAKNIQQGKIKIQIEKGLQNGMLSIYSIDKFTEYINTLSLSQFFAIIDMRFTTSLVFEVQDELYPKWSTNTIAFIGKDGKYEISDMENVNRESRIKEVRNLCYHEIEKYKLLPEDLFYSQYDGNDSLQSAFIKACMIYTFSFVFDYSALKNDNYEYKLNGFRTLSGHIKVKPLSKINVNINSCKLIYEIYKWLYLGGNNNDKINIARNIISLNIEKESLYINSSTFESILSNYKIYEKENVKQYLQVRNKLSELLIDLQGKISSIVDSFISDFKKIFLTLVSFFISVVAIRVISKGDFIGGFTNEIIVLSFIFLLISVGLLLYSRWELTKKITLYNKHYRQIKDRYKDILSGIELEKIFEECDPQKDDTNASFILKQKKIYSWLWFLSILLLSLFLVVVFFINNDISIYCIINEVICYTQSIFR